MISVKKTNRDSSRVFAQEPDIIAWHVKFAGTGTNSITALKKVVLPAMTSTVVKAKFKGHWDANATYVANICAPRTPMVLGMPSLVNIDDNNALGIMEIEEEEQIPLTDDFISSVCQDIHNCFPKVKRKRLSRDDI